jgi:uncharacterized protein
MTPSFLYLHGFASAPGTGRALFFSERLSRWQFRLRVPDLNLPAFSHLSMTAMVKRLSDEVLECPEGPIHIIASSLGAAAAILFLADPTLGRQTRRIQKLILLAPSLDFAQNRLQELGEDGLRKWRDAGYLSFYHFGYGERRPLHFGFMSEMQRINLFNEYFSTPTLIFHGTKDEVVDYQQSVNFANDRPNVTLKLLNATHRLEEYSDDALWSAAVQFLQLCHLKEEASDLYLEAYDLSDPIDRKRFKEFEDSFVLLLESAYGSATYGRDVHLNRIYGEQHTVILAFTPEPEKNSLVGCSYIRPDGKRSATAVARPFRNRGIGRRLICKSVELFPRQFTEVSPLDKEMQGLLRSVGFSPVTNEKEIRELLRDDSRLIESINHVDQEIIYHRRASHADIKHNFIMFAFTSDSTLTRA